MLRNNTTVLTFSKVKILLLITTVLFNNLFKIYDCIVVAVIIWLILS
jgi:hypothetical protein